MYKLVMFVDQNLGITHACGVESGNETARNYSDAACEPEPGNYSCLDCGVQSGNDLGTTHACGMESGNETTCY